MDITHLWSSGGARCKCGLLDSLRDEITLSFGEIFSETRRIRDTCLAALYSRGVGSGPLQLCCGTQNSIIRKLQSSWFQCCSFYFCGADICLLSCNLSLFPKITYTPCVRRCVLFPCLMNSWLVYFYARFACEKYYGLRFLVILMVLAYVAIAAKSAIVLSCKGIGNGAIKDSEAVSNPIWYFQTFALFGIFQLAWSGVVKAPFKSS